MIPTGIGMGTTITIEETGTIIGEIGTMRTTATGVKIPEVFYFLEEGSGPPARKGRITVVLPVGIGAARGHPHETSSRHGAASKGPAIAPGQ